MLYVAGVVWLHSAAWGVVLGFAGLFAAALPLNLWTRKRLEKGFSAVQEYLAETQGVLRRKMQMLQNKMGGGGKGLQRKIEKEQAEAVHKALEMLDSLKPLYKWSVLAERQVNTLRAQLHYQLKEFEDADRCLKKCLIMDPTTLAMRMARDYAHGEWKKLEKAFKRGVKRYKDEKGVILYALYSWILVKEGRIDEAVQVLDKGKEETENEVLRSNWEHLVNGRTRHFSNAGLGETWYALMLETPKPVKVRQRRGRIRR